LLFQAIILPYKGILTPWVICYKSINKSLYSLPISKASMDDRIENALDPIEDCRINAYPSFTEYQGINRTPITF
jgi:hypothetical protein